MKSLILPITISLVAFFVSCSDSSSTDEDCDVFSDKLSSVKCAVKEGHELDERKIASGNDKEKDKLTPLMVAGKYGRLDIAKVLVEAGADRSLKSNGKKAYEYAIPKYLEMVPVLFDPFGDFDPMKYPEVDPSKLPAKIDPTNLPPLTDPYYYEAMKQIDNIKKKCADVDIYKKDSNGQIPIMKESKIAKFNCLYLRDPYTVNALDRFNQNTLTIQAMANHKEITSKILDDYLGQTNINNQNLSGGTALISLTYQQNLPMIQKFIDKGADPNIRDNEGRTALGWATIGSDTETYLINIGATR